MPPAMSSLGKAILPQPIGGLQTSAAMVAMDHDSPITRRPEFDAPLRQICIE